MSDIYDSMERTSRARAWDDLIEGVGFWRLWGAMGWQDVRNRYRRSVLGPFWLTLSMAILAGSLALVYGTMFQIDIADYIGYLCVGLSAWSLLSSSLVEGCQVYLGSEYIIKQTRLPYSVYVFRAVWRNLIIFLHNITIFFVVTAMLGAWPGAVGLLAIAGLAIMVVNAVWLSVFLGIACVRFRDIPPIVANLSQLFFLVTPIMWKAEHLGARRYLVDFNPVYHVLEIVRAPLLGMPPSGANWATAILFTVAGCAITFGLFSAFRSRIAYWL